MSFLCQITNKVVFNETCHKVVVETRDKIYLEPNTNEEVGRGKEIVKEINVSEEGLKILASRLQG